MRSNLFVEKEFQFSEQMFNLNLLIYFSIYREKLKLSNNSEKNTLHPQIGKPGRLVSKTWFSVMLGL